jgi:hypothetical protein
MPPVVHSSDESDTDGADVIMPRNVKKQADDSEDEVDPEAIDDDEEEEGGDDEEYIVEAIMDHRFDGNVSG